MCFLIGLYILIPGLYRILNTRVRTVQGLIGLMPGSEVIV